MLDKIFKQIIKPQDENREDAVIEYLVGLDDDDYKRVSEAIKLFRKGESLREDYYDKANMILQSQNDVDFIESPAEAGGSNEK